jgi:hypothetical protein
VLCKKSKHHVSSAPEFGIRSSGFGVFQNRKLMSMYIYPYKHPKLIFQAPQAHLPSNNGADHTMHACHCV